MVKGSDGVWRVCERDSCVVSPPAVTFVFPSALVLHIWQADTKALFHRCSSRCGWHFIQVEQRAGLTRAADEETEPEGRERLNPSWSVTVIRRVIQRPVIMRKTAAQIQQEKCTVLKKRLVRKQKNPKKQNRWSDYSNNPLTERKKNISGRSNDSGRRGLGSFCFH